MSDIFSALKMGDLNLPNRIVMAPMTRSRAKLNAPDVNTAIYYAQRASAGLIITEGAVVSQQARGYLWTPGIYTDEQIAGWRKVTDAVHNAGGRIFVQLWHVGRMSHVSLQPDAQAPVSSVDTRVSADWPVFAYDDHGRPAQVQPSQARGLRIEEIAEIEDNFVQAARNAVLAGFDGVELHAAGAYLFDQFINGGLNNRTDEYGGTIRNRLRFLLDTIDSISFAIGTSRVAVRISPEGRLKDGPYYTDEYETYTTLAAELSKREVVYLHINNQGISTKLLQNIRDSFQGILMLTGELNKDKSNALIKSNLVDLVGFGRLYIGNPDLVARLRNDWPLTHASRAVYYGGDNHGYTDFLNYDV